MLRIYIWNQTYLFTGSEGNFRTSLPILLLLNWNSKRWKLGTSTVLKVIFIKKKCNVSPCYIITMSPLSLPASVGRLKKLAVRNLLKSFFSSSDKKCQRAHIIDSGQRFTLACQESQGRWFCSPLPYYYSLKVYNTYIYITNNIRHRLRLNWTHTLCE